MIKYPYLQEMRDKIAAENDKVTPDRIKKINANSYYYKQLLRQLKFIIEKNSRVLHIRSGIGFILDKLEPSFGVGIEDSQKMIEESQKRYPNLKFVNQSPEDIQLDEKFDYILINSIEDIVDVQAVLNGVYKCCHPGTRIIIVNYHFLWHPFVRLAEKLKLKSPQSMHNWISSYDINNLLHLSGFEPLQNRTIIFFPYNIPGISYVLNRFFAKLPLFRFFTMNRLNIARPLFETTGEYTVSIIVPCKNEAGNIEDAVRRIPQLGSHTEIIFGDDKSTDGTPDIVREMMLKYPEKDIKLVDSPGISKAMNVWTCFDSAKGDILMILDADLTVIPEELPYFYEAISTRKGEFINGSRLVYPMHKDAMRLFNVIGNKFFSIAFTYILETKIKDTLCGTKVLWRTDYEHIKKLRGSWGINDRWCDYELIFGAAKRHLKIVDLPVHYMERTYGETKMTNRIKNGLVMLKMCRAALMKIKFS
jgi:ubiquinone/menaquinone biosynthesis C-methylase UbiE